MPLPKKSDLSAPPNNRQQFRTLNLSEAAYLVANDFKLVRVDPPEPPHALSFFAFDASPELLQAVLSFANSGLVRADRFAQAYTELRKRLAEIKQRERR